MVYCESMLEKKRPEKIKPALELDKAVTEILVANGRSVEPFIKVFQYSGENVTKSSLGTLVGIFDIAERSEESAYIVNFLASVAKKEYFNNPRRGAIESFEAALHKINLALAELVKHGNIAWLGKLHGALCVLEKNNLHFSVTGDAQILLLRNGNFSEISAGLASEESSLHPIKTFVEVSSGRMMLADKILLTSPELFTLFSLEDLSKNALRMDDERFAQFLRTALINELDMAGTFIIDVQEGQPPVRAPHRPEVPAEETVHNVFSQQAFAPPAKMQDAVPQEQEYQPQAPAPSEYVDSKTGHIYVQGDTPGMPPVHPLLERGWLVLQELGHTFGSFLSSQGKLLRKGRKQSFIFFDALARKSGVVARKTARFLRKQGRQSLAAIRTQASSLQASRTPEKQPVIATIGERRMPQSSPIAVTAIPHPDALPTENRRSQPAPGLPSNQEETIDIPPFMREKLSAFYQKNGVPKPLETARTASTDTAPTYARSLQYSLRQTLEALSSSLSALKGRSQGIRPLQERLRPLSQNKKAVIGVIFGGLFIIGIIGIGAFILTRGANTTPAQDIAVTTLPEPPALPPADEPEARSASGTPVTSFEQPVISLVSSRGRLLALTEGSIIDIETKQATPLPARLGKAAMAAAMDDLSAVFILGANATITTYYPGTHTFVDNAFPLPIGTHIDSLGTFLTYLYVLDAKQSIIWRFPRAEGGFGAPLSWLKERVTLDGQAQMLVTEKIFIHSGDAILAFFKGKKTAFEAVGTKTPLAIAALAGTEDSSVLFVLDTANKRIVKLDADGRLVAQYFSEQLSGAVHLTLSADGKTLYTVSQNSLLSFPVQ